MATRSFLHKWEQSAVLADEQRNSLAAFAALTDTRAFPAQMPVDDAPASHVETHQSTGAADLSLRGTKIENARDFHTWFAGLQNQVEAEQQEKYTSYLEDLLLFLSEVKEVGGLVEDIKNCLGELERKHEFVSTKTTTLYSACEELVKDKGDLTQMLESIRMRLSYFDELDRITRALNVAHVDVVGEEFLRLLVRLDECITYVSHNTKFRDSSAYLLRFRALQNRGLTLIKTHVVALLRNTTAEILHAMAAQEGQVDATEGSVIYLAFRKIAPSLQVLIAEIENRSSRPEYTSLLTSCHNCYYEQRQRVLTGIVTREIARITESEADMTNMTREGSLYMLRVCQLEHTLFCRFFRAEDGLSDSFFSDGVGGILYTELRPRFIQLHDINSLADVCSLLKIEISEHINRRGDGAEAFRPLIRKILGDVQGRLTFRAQIHIRDNISGFFPSDDDLKYPDKLVHGGEGDKSRYAAWYPTLETTLTSLSKLYRSVDLKTFEGLAQEAVAECTASLLYASEMIGKKSMLDGHLFLIKHLLVLREQISPFEVDFTSTERSLDFSNVSMAWSSLATGSLFSLSNNPLMGFLGQATPQVATSQVDSKQVLEKELKDVCEVFMLNVQREAAQSVSTLVDKVSKAVSLLQSQGIDPRRAGGVREQPFTAVDAIKTCLADAPSVLECALTRTYGAMGLYLTDEVAVALFRPIKANIIELYQKLHALLEDYYSVDERLQIDAPPVISISGLLEKISNRGSEVTAAAAEEARASIARGEEHAHFTQGNIVEVDLPQKPQATGGEAPHAPQTSGGGDTQNPQAAVDGGEGQMNPVPSGESAQLASDVSAGV